MARHAPSGSRRSCMSCVLDLQRRLLGLSRRRLAAADALRRGIAPWAIAGGSGAGRRGGAGPARAHGTSGLASGGARGCPGESRAAARTRPRPMGCGANRSRAGRAGSSAGCRKHHGSGDVLQAAIAACHARALEAAATDWTQIARLYGVLEQRLPTPVIALNRAMAVSMAEGPAAGLVLVDELRGAVAGALSPAAGRPRRSALQAWTAGGSPRRIRSRRRLGRQRPRA